MQPREKKLALVVAGLVVVMGLYWGYGKVTAAFDRRSAQLGSLDQAIRDKKFEILRGQKAAQRRARWRRQSLPSNDEQAKFLYQSWLRSLVQQAGLDDAQVGTQIARARRGLYTRFTFTVSGRASLPQLTRLLFDFYQADHLHQVRSLRIEPVSESKKFDIMLSIEALSLPGADRIDTLNDKPGTRLASDSLDEYTDTIVGRNLFAAYVPPPPEKPAVVRRDPPKPPPTRPKPKPPSFDVAKYAFVTAILQERTGRRVWLNVRTTGETLKLGVGETFQVGELQGQVAEVTDRSVVFNTGEGRILVELGENLRQGARLPDEEI